VYPAGIADLTAKIAMHEAYQQPADEHRAASRRPKGVKSVGFQLVIRLRVAPFIGSLFCDKEAADEPPAMSGIGTERAGST
jgi:hypothetical protein